MRSPPSATDWWSSAPGCASEEPGRCWWLHCSRAQPVALRKTLFTMDFHGPLVVHDCVLLAALVLVLRARLSGWILGALTRAAGANGCLAS